MYVCFFIFNLRLGQILSHLQGAIIVIKILLVKIIINFSTKYEEQNKLVQKRLANFVSALFKF